MLCLGITCHYFFPLFPGCGVSGGLQPAAVATPRLGISSLDRAVQGYFMTSLSPGTLLSYRTALGSYLSFCHQFGFLSPFPSSESLLSGIVIWVDSGVSEWGSLCPDFPRFSRSRFVCFSSVGVCTAGHP